jgi:phosphoribosylglycinamide formyltransferase-1
LNPPPASLIVDLADERFDHRQTHHLLEALGSYAGITPSRLTRVPDRVLASLDAVFGGWWSSQIAAGSAWLAEDAAGFLGIAGFDARGSVVKRFARDPGTGIFGPFGFMKRAHPDLQIAFLHGGLFALRERGYARALIPEVGDRRQVAFYEREAGARPLPPVPPPRTVRTVILASGAGSNFEAVLREAKAGRLPLDLTALFVNRAASGAAAIARAAGLAVRELVWERGSETRAAYDRRLEAAVAAEEPELVLLLGWMHVLDGGFLERFPEVLNVHPAYLPLDPSADVVTYPDGSELPVLRGARAVDHALAAGYRWIGASVHRLGADVDRGEVLVRAPLAVVPGRPREELMGRLHALEHRIVVDAIRRWSAETA